MLHVCAALLLKKNQISSSSNTHLRHLYIIYMSLKELLYCYLFTSDLHSSYGRSAAIDPCDVRHARRNDGMRRPETQASGNCVSTTALAPACMLRGVAQRSCRCAVAGRRVPRRETSSWHTPLGRRTSTGAPRSTLTTRARASVLQDWQAPTAVAAYLTAAFDEGDRAMCFVALRTVADAHGLQTGASNAQRHRDHRSRMRSAQGHPSLGSLIARRAALTGR